MADRRPSLGDQSQPLQGRLTYRLSRLTARLNAHAARILQQTAGISLSKWRVLVVLAHHGPMTASEIARRTFTDKALVSRTLKAMSAEGLVSLRHSERDGRVQIVDLTESGIAAFQRAEPHMADRQRWIVSGLTEAERTAFDSALTKVEQMILPGESAT